MSLKAENWDGVTAPTISSGWTANSPAVTTSSFLGGVTPTSSPNAIKVAAQGGGAPLRYITWGTADTNSGDVSVQANFNSNSVSDSLSYGLFARCDVSAAVRASSTFYAWELDLVNLTSKVIKDVAGTVTTLSTVSSIGLSAAIWYTATFTLLGTQLTVAVQRSSDSKWLTSAGTWQTAAANVHSLTDSSITGAGYAGLALSARSDTAYSDDWTLSAATAPVTVTAAITAGNDAFSAAGTDTAFGSLSRTESHDTFAGLAPITAGMLAATGGADSAAIAGTCIVASLATTGGADTLAAAGSFTASGAGAATGGADSLSAAGRFTASGSAAATGGDDALAGSGNNTFFAAGTLLAGGADTFAGTGFYGPSAALSPTESGDAFAGVSGLAVTAALGAAGGADALAGFESDLLYNIYSNTGIADPINSNSPIASTAFLTWTSSPLAFPGVWRFGVRAYDPVTMLEEENLDCAVTIILDAAGIDITNRPKAPTALRAKPRAGGTIRVEWAYNTINPSPMPTGFHVYKGTGGTPNYASPAATVLFNASIAGSFVTDLAGLTDGTVYTIGVRAYNSTAEEPNTVTVNCTADATGPTAVVSLMATAI